MRNAVRVVPCRIRTIHTSRPDSLIRVKRRADAGFAKLYLNRRWLGKSAVHVVMSKRHVLEAVATGRTVQSASTSVANRRSKVPA